MGLTEEVRNSRKQSMLLSSHIPKMYTGDIKLRPYPTDKSAFDVLKKYKDDIVRFVNDGYNLLIYSSNVGNGKTSWAIKLALAYLDYICAYAPDSPPVIYVNLKNYLDSKKASFEDKSMLSYINDLEYELKNARLVIWDDIGIKGLTEYEQGIFYNLIEYRTSNLKSNIYTSNIGLKEFSESFGERTADRILGYADKIQLSGPSMRTNKSFI